MKRALNSVISQTHTPKEIIVIDDGSQDETYKIQKDFPQIRYIYKQNGGVSSARNLGIKHAKNEWIAFLDSDDEWHKDKLAKQVEFHKNNPEILISYTDELWIRDAKEVKIPKKFRKFGGYIFEKCLGHCIIAPSAIFVFRDLLFSVMHRVTHTNSLGCTALAVSGEGEKVLEQDGAAQRGECHVLTFLKAAHPEGLGCTALAVGGGEKADEEVQLKQHIQEKKKIAFQKEKFEIFSESLEICEDYDLWLRISSKYPIGLVDEKLIVKYAGHGDQLSFKHWGMDRFRVLALENLLSEANLGHATLVAFERLNKGEAKATRPEHGECHVLAFPKAAYPKDLGCTASAVPSWSESLNSQVKKVQLKQHIQKLITTELTKKYTLLLKGAIKYDKMHDAKIYKERLARLGKLDD